MNIDREVYYTGRVQGVGFRYSVKQIAASYEVTGWVRNLDDGRVELRASGEEGEVAAFLEAITKSHLAAHIKEVAQGGAEPGTGRSSGFEIRP